MIDYCCCFQSDSTARRNQRYFSVNVSCSNRPQHKRIRSLLLHLFYCSREFLRHCRYSLSNCCHSSRCCRCRTGWFCKNISKKAENGLKWLNKDPHLSFYTQKALKQHILAKSDLKSRFFYQKMTSKYRGLPQNTRFEENTPVVICVVFISRRAMIGNRFYRVTCDGRTDSCVLHLLGYVFNLVLLVVLIAYGCL